eukprot:scaffold24592_cov20-Prasinocladus_malaysianus.AAC.1
MASATTAPHEPPCYCRLSTVLLIVQKPFVTEVVTVTAIGLGNMFITNGKRWKAARARREAVDDGMHVLCMYRLRHIDDSSRR